MVGCSTEVREGLERVWRGLGGKVRGGRLEKVRGGRLERGLGGGRLEKVRAFYRSTERPFRTAVEQRLFLCGRSTAVRNSNFALL